MSGTDSKQCTDLTCTAAVDSNPCTKSQADLVDDKEILDGNKTETCNGIKVTEEKDTGKPSLSQDDKSNVENETLQIENQLPNGLSGDGEDTQVPEIQQNDNITVNQSLSDCNDLIEKSIEDGKQPPSVEQGDTTSHVDKNNEDHNNKLVSGSDDETCSRVKPYRRKSSGHVTSGLNLLSVQEMPTPPDADQHEEEDVGANDLNPDTVLGKCKTDVINPLETTKTDEFCSHMKQNATSEQPQASDDQSDSSESTPIVDDSRSSENETSPSSSQQASASPKTLAEHNDDNNVILHNNKDNKNLAKDTSQLPFPPDHKDKRLDAKNSNPAIKPDPHKKNSKIPIGIAVAWQRLVTTNSSIQNPIGTTVTSAPLTIKSPSTMGLKPQEKVPIPQQSIPPVRPSSASPTHAKLKEEGHRSGLGKKSGASESDRGVSAVGVKRNVLDTSGIKTLAPDEMGSNCRPIPSSSVPPSIYLHGHPQTPSSILDYGHYGPGMRSMTPYPHQTTHHSHFSLPPSWQVTNPLNVGFGHDLSVPQGFPAGTYMQESMQNHLHQLTQQFRSNYAGLMYPHSLSSSPGYESLRHHCEQLMHQSEYLRQLHQQQLVGSALYPMNEGLRNVPTTFPPSTTSPRVSIPLLSPSPTGGVRTPTPNSGLMHTVVNLSSSTSLSPAGLSPHTGSNWSVAAEFYHHNSSAALSPKSLTSSSPSPITVLQQHENLGLVNTLARNNNNTLASSGSSNCQQTSPVASSSSSSSRAHEWEDASSKPTHIKKKILSMSASLHKGPEEKALLKAPENEGKGNIMRPEENMTKSQKASKHDFKRLDSLIERREETNDIEQDEPMDMSKKSNETVIRPNLLQPDQFPVEKVRLADAQDVLTPITDLKSSMVHVDGLPDVNQNVKLTLPNSARCPKLKTEKASERKSKTCESDTVKKPRKPRAVKPKSESENLGNFNPPKTKKKSGKRAAVDEGSSESAGKARKPCNIKPDININQSSSDIPDQATSKQEKKTQKSYKSRKKGEKDQEQRNSFSDLLDLSGAKADEGNDVPELKLPVDTSKSVLSSSDSFKSNVTIKVPTPTSGLSGDDGAVTGSSGKVYKKYSKKRVEDVMNALVKPKRGKQKNEKPVKVRKVKEKVEKVKKSRSKKQLVSIKSKLEGNHEASSTIGAIPCTPTVILTTTPHQQAVPLPVPLASLPGNQQIVSSCVAPVAVSSYPHTSPVTLILPRIIPQQSTIMTNANQRQTSFKLVMASPHEIKIPAIVPNSEPRLEGATSNFQFNHQQETSRLGSCTVKSATMSAASVRMSTPSFDSTLSGRENTITFIRDSPVSPDHVVAFNGHTNALSSPVHSPTTPSRKGVQSEDNNHLNLLATVAQEFGSREDLGKLACHSGSSRGSSLMTSPTLQSPELNFPTPSSTVSSGNTTTTSISLPSSPLNGNNKVTPSKSHYDEYEYDDDKEPFGETPAVSGSYKQSVWLKIPQIVPKAGNKATEKKLRKQPKQAKRRMSEEEMPLKKRKLKGLIIEDSDVITTKQKPNTKLKIPKITVLDANEESRPEKPKKAKKVRTIKDDDANSKMKLKISVPKVDKLKIKLPKESDKQKQSGTKKPRKAKKAQTVKSENLSSSSENEREFAAHKESKSESYQVENNNNSHAWLTSDEKKHDNISGESGPMVDKPVSLGNPLPSSFTSLTPPPTATPSYPPGQSSMTAFSPKTISLEEGNNNRGESGHESDTKVSDPLYAASAFRMHLHNNNNNANNNGISKYEFSSDEDDPEEVLMEYERRTAGRMRSEQDGEKEEEEEEEEDNEMSVKVPIKTYPAKRTSSNKHVKPCVKPEPIVRRHFLDSSSSDEETDYEVASLTTSIPKRMPSTPSSQGRNHRKLIQPESKGSTKAFNKKMKTERKSGLEKKRRLSSITTKKEKTHIRRRLSLNIDSRRTRTRQDEKDEDEEELLDIVSDYASTASHNGHYHTKGERHKGMNKKDRRVSGTSSSSYFPAIKMPKKRASRSLTTSSQSSTSSVIGVSSRSRASGRNHNNTMKETTQHSGADVNKLDETLIPGKVELDSVDELKDEMRILTEIQGLFYTGKLNALQPPDVYGVTLDNERGHKRPHLIFSAEEVLEKCVREKKSRTLTVGLRICAYWSPQYSGLYTGRVSRDFNPNFDPEKDLIPIEFDDGDTGLIKLSEIRLLPDRYPIRAYDPNPLVTLEKKHRKRRHSAATTNTSGCTGDHEEPDCGESYCAKLAKFEEEQTEQGETTEEEEGTDPPKSYKSLYWTWTGLGYKNKRSKSKKVKNKEFFRGIQRGDEIINIGDSAIFISHGNERPYIGRIEKFWEEKGQKVVTVRWFYHPEEVQSPKRIPHLKHPGALFESPHIDENDVQTIAKKCDVLPFTEFKEKIGKMPKLLIKSSDSTKPRDLYYIAGFYDPYTYNLQMKV